MNSAHGAVPATGVAAKNISSVTEEYKSAINAYQQVIGDAR